MRPVLFAALLLAACQTEAPSDRVPGAITPAGDVVFKINGDMPVYQNMYDAVLTRIPPEQRARMQEAPGGMQRLEEQMAMSQILYTRALEEGITKDPEIAVGLAMSERDYLAAIYVQRQGEKAITDEAIAKRYEEKKVQYSKPQVKARHILVKEESKANEIKAKLDAGGDFVQLAKENSEDPGSKDKGGELGWFEARRMDPAFSAAAFDAEKGAIVGPVSTRFGFHLIQVEDKRDSVPLEEVKEEIAGSLRQDAIQEMLTKMQTELKLVREGEQPAQAGVTPGITATPTTIQRPPRPGAPPPNHPSTAPVKPTAPAGAAPAPAPAAPH